VSNGANKKYALQDYDYILIVASWGKPKEYIPSAYVLEVEEISNSNKRRTVIGGNDKITYWSSTTAIRDLLYKKIGISNENIGMLIFCQDTILIDYIKEIISDTVQQKEIERGEIKEKLLYKLYEEGRQGVNRDIGIRDYRAYERLVRFVPGVITRVEGSYMYSWRYEHCYDLLLGSIILYTYKRLNEIPKDAKKIAILLDTTHGINYFVTALKEGVLRASMLYALSRVIESSDDKSLEQCTIYHYNSDPISEPPKGTPSLKIHMLDKIAVVKNGKVLLNTLFAEAEEHVLREGLKVMENELNNYWKDVEWGKILGALILFSRGLLIWSLRLSQGINKIPDIKELENAVDELRLRIKEDKDRIFRYKLSYTSFGRDPMRYVVEYSILANMLKDLSNKIVCKEYVYGLILDALKELLKGTGAKMTKCSQTLYNTLQNFVKDSGKYMCFNVENVRNVIGKIYTSPYSDIIENEINEVEEYLNGEKETSWNPCPEGASIYVEPHTRSTYMIEDSNVRIIISTPMNPDRRNVYAHGGLAYGLPWLAIHLFLTTIEKNISILCLGELDVVLGLV